MSLATTAWSSFQSIFFLFSLSHRSPSFFSPPVFLSRKTSLKERQIKDCKNLRHQHLSFFFFFFFSLFTCAITERLKRFERPSDVVKEDFSINTFSIIRQILLNLSRDRRRRRGGGSASRLIEGVVLKPRERRRKETEKTGEKKGRSMDSRENRFL